MSDTKKPFSVHSFMLPFRWDYLPMGYTTNTGKEQISFEERTDLNSFLKCLLHDNSHWQRKFFTIDGQAANFNEYHYFHAYAAKTIFDLQQKDEKLSTTINANKVMVYFELGVDPLTDASLPTPPTEGGWHRLASVGFWVSTCAMASVWHTLASVGIGWACATSISSRNGFRRR